MAAGKGKDKGKGKQPKARQGVQSSNGANTTSTTGGSSTGSKGKGPPPHPNSSEQPFARMPQKMSCPQCRKTILTTITPVNGTAVWVLGVSLCLCILWPCAICVLFFDELKDWQHTCPVCGYHFGTYQRLQC